MPVKGGLDTSFVIGLLDEQDVWHSQAKLLQDVLDSNDCRTFIFDCVLGEVISTLARRTHEKRRAADFSELTARIKKRFPTKVITWLYPDLPGMFDSVTALVERSGGELNFNDALIAISCQQRGIPYLVSFDSDFDRVDKLIRIGSPDDLAAL